MSMKTIELEKLDVNIKDKKRVVPNLGIKENDRHEISESLKKVLADSYCLMMMSQNYHWNVRGMLFKNIHEMTEEQYTNLFEAIDDIAERVRALGFTAPGTLKDFNDNTDVNLPNAELSDQEMLVDLIDGHETLVRGIRKAIKVADQHDDEVTVDMLTARMNWHEKNAWMMRSFLEK